MPTSDQFISTCNSVKSAVTKFVCLNVVLVDGGAVGSEGVQWPNKSVSFLPPLCTPDDGCDF